MGQAGLSWEQRLWSRTVLGQGTLQVLLWQPSCLLHQAFVCLSGTQPGPRHHSCGPVTPIKLPNSSAGARGVCTWC